MGHDHAVPYGADAAELTRRLDTAHDRFISTGDTDPSVRSVVTESWQRSVDQGVDPEHALARIVLDDAALAEIRSSHPLTAVMPVIRRLLVDSATEAGLVVAVSDAAGQLLYVEGARSLRSRAEAMHFVPGADWSEASAGTNAPGTALALDRPVQILGPEHLARQVTPWSCSASPIHDPDNGALLGVLDVTGGAEVAAPHALHLVRATAAAAEAELRIARLSRAAGSGFSISGSGWCAPRLAVLGRNSAELSVGTTTTRLSLRHSEMVLLLSEATEGLTTGELAVALTEDDQAPVTVRAEVSRLRRLLGPLELSSRPYRIASEVRTDVEEVRSALADGRTRSAVGAYPGPALPHSNAPAVTALRDDLHAQVRSAALASTDADTVLAFADTPHGRDDYEAWARALDALPADSPRRRYVVSQVERLDHELA